AASIAQFDRRTLKIENTISLGCSPRSIAYEPRSKLVFAVCGSNLLNPSPSAPTHRPSGSASRPSHSTGSDEDNNFAGISHIIAIDTQSRAAIADIAIAGDARFAQPDGVGAVYLSVAAAERLEYRHGGTNRIVSPPRIAKFDGPAISAEADRLRH